MDTSVYSHIIAIAEDGNIARAADRLFLSRSTLNRQLLITEKELGTEIFKRVSNTLILTHAGEVFLKMARKIVADEKDGLKTIEDITQNNRGRISIGMPICRSDIILPTLLEKFSKLYPNVSIVFAIGSSGEQRKMLAQGKIDIAIMSKDELAPDFKYDEISREEFLLITSKSHRHAHLSGFEEDGQRKQCELEWFKSDRFGMEVPGSSARSVSEHVFAAAHLEPKIFVDNCKYTILMQLANDGLCSIVALDTFFSMYDNLVGFSLNPRSYFTLVAARRQDYVYSKVEQAFFDLIMSYYN